MRTAKLRTMLFSISLLFGHFFTAAAEVGPAPPPDDYTLHTLYIFNFVKYVEWPSGANKSLKIGVVGSESAEENLTKMSKGRSIGPYEVSVVNTKNDTELASCQIIFIPTSNSSLATKLIESFKDKPILIVTEEADLTKKGASMSFKIVASKLRFQINEEAIKGKGLKIASALLSLAEKS